MDFHLDQSLVALGIDTVVVGIARNVDPQAVLPPSFLEKKKAVEQWALQCQTEEVAASPVIKAYTDLLQKVGRSIKKQSLLLSETSSIVVLCLRSIASSISIMSNL